MKELLFSVGKADFEIQTFRSGGKGGQNQNKVNSGCRIIHKASGARGEARDSRTFLQNRKNAFLRLLETPEWKAWYKLECARRMGQVAVVEESVNRSLDRKHLKIEGKVKGKWVEIE